MVWWHTPSVKRVAHHLSPVRGAVSGFGGIPEKSGGLHVRPFVLGRLGIRTSVGCRWCAARGTGIMTIRTRHIRKQRRQIAHGFTDIGPEPEPCPLDAV